MLVYRGWSSPAGLAAYRAGRRPAMVAELGRHGVTGAYFRGYSRAAFLGAPDPHAAAEW